MLSTHINACTIHATSFGHPLESAWRCTSILYLGKIALPLGRGGFCFARAYAKHRKTRLLQNAFGGNTRGELHRV